MRRLVILAVAAIATTLLLPLAAHAAPVVNSFVIKGGAVATSSTVAPIQIDVAGATKMQFSVDASATWSEWGAYAETTSVALPDVDGEKTVLAHFADDADTVVDASDTILLDTTAPTGVLEVDSPPNAAGWYKKAPQFWFTSNEAGSIWYWWDSLLPWLPFVPAVDPPQTAFTGTHTLEFYALDELGNQQAPFVSRTFKVDETSPTVQATGLLQTGWSANDQVATLTGADTGGSGLAAVKWRVGSGSVQSGASGSQVTFGTDGTHTFEYWSTDVAENESPHSSATVRIDETTPTVTAAGVPAGWSKSPVNVTFDAQDGTGSGVKAVTWRLDDGPAQTTALPPITANGDHKLEFWVTDNVDRQSVPQVKRVKIDALAPVTTSDAAASYERVAVVNLAPTDAHSQVATTQWRVDGGAWQSGRQARVDTLGTHTLEFRSTDNAGNTEATKSVTTRVFSRTGILLSGPAIAPKYNGEAVLTARLVDSAGAPIANQTVIFRRWNGSQWIEFPVPTTTDGYVFLRSQALTLARTYYVRFERTDKYEPTAETAFTLLPKARLTRSTSWKTLTKGKAYYAKGFIEPKHAKSDANKVKVRVYKKGKDKKYHLYKSFTASYSAYSSSKSRYSAKVVLKSKGSYKLIAYHAADSLNAETFGSADYFTVK